MAQALKDGFVAEGATAARATHFAIALRTLERMLKGRAVQVDPRVTPG